METPIVTFINSIFNQPAVQAMLTNLKILFVAFALGLLVFNIIILFRTNWLRFRFLEDIFEFFTYQPYGTKRLLKEWNKIKGRLDVGSEAEYKLAVIEADSALDEILKKMAYAGDTLGEKLSKISPAVIPNIEELQEAHKIRNNIVHDPDYRLNLNEAKKAISMYEKSLTELGAI